MHALKGTRRLKKSAAGKAGDQDERIDFAQVIANTSVFGADWRELTWWEYQARLYWWNEAHSTDRAPADPVRLNKLLEARNGGHC